MAKIRNWEGMRAMSERLLEERTGKGVATWNRRVKKEGLDDEKPGRPCPPSTAAETRRTAATLEDSRDDARPDQPYFGERSRRGSRALVTPRLSRECLSRSRCFRNLYRSRGAGGQVPHSAR